MKKQVTQVLLALLMGLVQLFGCGKTQAQCLQQIALIGNVTDFGASTIYSKPVIRTFNIRNAGTEDLVLTGLSFSGNNAGDFILAALPNPMLTPGESTTFQVGFSPLAVGLRKARITIGSNDCTAQRLEFEISGEGKLDSTFPIPSKFPNGTNKGILISPTVTINGVSYKSDCNLDSIPIVLEGITATPTAVDSSYASQVYSWSTGKIQGLQTGWYAVTMTDAAFQTTTDCVLVLSIPPFRASILGDSVLCNGDTLGQLRAIGRGGQDNGGRCTYQWSNGGTDEILSGIPVGTYAVTVTNSLGCTAEDSITLRISEPLLGLGADFSICPGTSRILSASSQYSAYLWSDGTTDSVISINQPGVYSCTVWTADGCEARDTVQVNAGILNQEIITPLGLLAYCGTLRLIGDSTLTNYLWGNGSTDISIKVTGFSGPITLSGINANGCNVSDTVHIEYQPALAPDPTITCTPSSSFCAGTSITLDAGEGYSTYHWSNGSLNQTTKVSQTGTYSVRVTNDLGCSAQRQIAVKSLPAQLPELKIEAGTFSTTKGFPSYLWYRNNHLLPGETHPTYTPTEEGYYHVVVLDSNGCTGVSHSVRMTPSCVDKPLECLRVYPIPFVNDVTLFTLQPIEDSLTILVQDIHGKKLALFNLSTLLSATKLGLSEMPPGTYILSVKIHRSDAILERTFRIVKAR